MNETLKGPKYRHELKYQISPLAIAPLRQRLRAFMLSDPNSGADGRYIVTSLYFDNCFDKALKEKVCGINRREKFRLRYYGTDTGRIFLEKKQKHNGLCLKSSELITSDICRLAVSSDFRQLMNEESPLVQELGIKMQTQLLRPKNAVRYSREALIYGPGNVRITFDTGLMTTMCPSSFTNPGTAGWISAEGAVLEVKYDEYLPEPVLTLLGSQMPQLQSFSKYARTRSVI